MAETTPAPKIRQLFISALFGVFLSIVTTIVLLQVFVVPQLVIHESRITALEARVTELEGTFEEELAEDAEIPEEGAVAAPAAEADAGTPAAATDAGTP